ncbi:MAG: hypothetical protein V3S69_03690 [Dehalococcoidales bacterium]
MFLMNEGEVVYWTQSTLLVESAHPLGFGSDLLTRIIIPNRVSSLAGVEILCTQPASQVLKIVLATLDNLSAVDAPTDLLDSSATHSEGEGTPCRHPSDVTANLIYNLTVLAAATEGTVHVQGVNYPTIPDQGVVLRVDRTITQLGFQPVVSIYQDSVLCAEGDPANFILEQS